jgi:hypothetical protein
MYVMAQGIDAQGGGESWLGLIQLEREVNGLARGRFSGQRATNYIVRAELGRTELVAFTENTAPAPKSLGEERQFPAPIYHPHCTLLPATRIYQ